MGVRDERVNDLIFEDQTSEGEPTENGIVRLVDNELVLKTSDGIKKFTAITWRRYFLTMGG